MPNGRQSKVRQALRHWAFKKVSDDVMTAHEPAEVLRWIADNCPTISELTDPATLRTVLDRLTRNLNGQLASPSTFAKRRVVLHAVFEYAHHDGVHHSESTRCATASMDHAQAPEEVGEVCSSSATWHY